eukprot:TRINITY_DN16897_c0_g2_i3.p1 TRINITY_DN16897_c0_g2~~TRINITY_DN16897_c0_g2_i3.p1  ORF type:complete len:522 (+),score=223.75 TRINITY_DN16897_c0_g2_i3:60-1568(+)
MKAANAALRAAGYHYVPAGKQTALLPREADQLLRQTADSEKGFEWKGQEDYDKLGDAVSGYLYAMLEETYGLRRHEMSGDERGEGFVSVPVFEQRLDSETVLVLVQGSGAVTPGMWARSLCINNSLHEGTIFPYIRAAQQRRWGLLVANPNTEAAGNECAELHTRKLFEKFVLPSPARNVVVVAHSYGGCSMTYFLKTCTQADRDRISAIAFTDSVHRLRATVPTDAEVAKAEKPEQMKKTKERYERLKGLVPEAFEDPSQEVADFLKLKTRNWVMSKEPLGTPVKDLDEGCPTVSAGHPDHVWTSGTSFPDVFDYLDSFFPPRPLSSSEKLQKAGSLKAEGNAFLKEKQFKKASFHYKEALNFLKGVTMASGGEDMAQFAEGVMKKAGKWDPPSEEIIVAARDLSVVISNNLAQARLNLEDWEGCVRYASDALKTEPENAKALFRRSTAFLKLGRIDEAEQGAKALRAKNCDEAAALLAEVAQARKAFQEKEKKKYANMFD